MMRYLGLRNTFAKSCRKGWLQYRDCSSASEKVVTAGTKYAEYGFKSVFGGLGFVVGGLTSSPVAKQVQETEEIARKELQQLDEYEAHLEALTKE